MDMAFQILNNLFISGNVFFIFWLLKFGITRGIPALLDSCFCPNQWSVPLHSQQSSYLSTAFCNKQRFGTQVFPCEGKFVKGHKQDHKLTFSSPGLCLKKQESCFSHIKVNYLYEKMYLFIEAALIKP